MSTASDARFWDRTSRKYALGAIADQAGYERTLDRTRFDILAAEIHATKDDKRPYIVARKR